MNKTVKISNLKEGNAETKKALENLYGKEVFNMKITDRVKTFDDAYEIAGRPRIPDFCEFSGADRSFFENMWKMTIIVKALNEDWEADWDNADEPKYYPYFYMSPSDFAFIAAHRDSAGACAGCGSNFRLKTAELAKYCGKQFIDIWKVIQKGF
jgi:hypothetical protein